MRTVLVLIAVFCSTFSIPAFASSENSSTTPSKTVRFNNKNWNSIVHPAIASFTVHADGSADGKTVTNIPFKQYTIYNVDGIRVQRFEIQDHYHFIVQGEIAYSKKELSILLAKYSAPKATNV